MSEPKIEPVKLEVIIKQFPVMLAALDKEGIVRVWNDACEKITGYSSDQVIGKPQALVMFFPERDYRESIIKLWNQTHDFSETHDQIKIRCANGTDKYISLTIRYRNNPIIENLNIWGIGQNITTEKNLKEDLANSELKFKTISKATNDVIWDWDLVNDQLWWGEGIQKVFGFSSVEIDNTIDWWVNLLHPEDKNRVFLKLNDFKNGTVDFWTDEYRFKRKNGTYAIVEDKGIIIRDGAGVPTRMIGGMVDQTDKKVQERDLVIRNKQLSEYAFYNSHKIRGPLVRLLSCVELIKMEDYNDENLKILLTQIKLSAEEVDKMIKEAGKLIASNRLEINSN
jgi:PAS domain S-box-containing protein